MQELLQYHSRACLSMLAFNLGYSVFAEQDQLHGHSSD